MQNRSSNSFYARALQAAEKNNITLAGKPQSESKDILGIQGACVGYALVPEGGTEDEFLQRSYRKQLAFENEMRKRELSYVPRDQVSLMASMSGYDAAKVEYAEIDQVEGAVSKLSDGFKKPMHIVGMMTTPAHAASFEILGNGQCRMRDANAGRVEDKCSAVFGFFRDLNKIGHKGTGKESFVYTATTRLDQMARKL